MSGRLNRLYQILMFIALWITGAFALRAWTILPSAIEMTSSRDLMHKIDGDTRWLFDHYQGIWPIIFIIWVSSLISVWVRYKRSHLVVVLSFIVLLVGANQMASIALKPIKQYEKNKQKQYNDFMDSSNDFPIKNLG